MSLCPFIDKIGIISEEDVADDKLKEPFVKELRKTSSIMGDVITFEKEVFHSKKIAFAIDTVRQAEVYVFISQDLCSGAPNKSIRDLAINKYIQEKGPYLFTYGKRVEKVIFTNDGN